ncbi:MAG: hypothetical protein HY240_01265 [Actinobacteria bacterium]|nr:hypothetical protein [Actinomycetota bacterium]
MRQATINAAEDSFMQEIEEFYCPVCGGGLSRSDLETPARDYYCPFCSTRQTPSTLKAS